MRENEREWGGDEASYLGVPYWGLPFFFQRGEFLSFPFNFEGKTFFFPLKKKSSVLHSLLYKKISSSKFEMQH